MTWTRLRFLPFRFLPFLFLIWSTAWVASPALAQGDPSPDQAAAEATEPEVASESDADSGLAELLRQRLRQLDGLEGVRVEVRYGIVKLSGDALSSQLADRAVQIADRTEGVVAVENQMQIETDLEQRVRPAYARSLERLRDIVSYSPLLVLAAIVVAIFAFLARLLGRWQALFRRISGNTFIQDLAKQVLQASVVVIGIVIALDILDATALVGAVLGSVGVLGLALGFAFRDLVENYISSVLLSLRRPFSPGDHVVIGDHEGKVMRLTSRATILMTLDGNHLRVPNSNVFKGVILNYSRNPRRRFDFDVGVGVGEDLLEAQRLGLEQLEELSGVLGDPGPQAAIVELGDSNVVIRFYGWVDQEQSSFLKVKAESIRRVKVRLEAAGMDLPEPIYRLLIKDQRGRPDAETGDRRADAGEPAEGEQDLSADQAIDGQIARERAEEGGTDLLDPSAPQE